MLVEVLVAIVLVAIGLLGVVAMAARATVTLTDSEFRTLATERAAEMMQLIWVGVDRTDANSVASSLADFVHQPDGDDCKFSGAQSGNASVSAWVDKIIDGAKSGTTTGAAANASTRLPGATGAMQQITYNPAASNLITITICWQGPNDSVPRQQMLSSYIN